MAEQKIRRFFLFRIESREDALTLIDDVSLALFFFAAVRGGIAVFSRNLMFVDAALIAILAFALRKWQSRLASVLLLVIGIRATAISTLNIAGVITRGNPHIILSLLVLWAAIRATEATFKLRGKFAKFVT